MKKEKYSNSIEAIRCTIGILGATGSVGREATKILMKNINYRLILGSRDEIKLKNTFGVSNEIKEYVQVDINDKSKLKDFCNRCDIVLNCSGPSEIILEKVATMCIEQGVHYVDVSGGEKLYDVLKSKEDIIKSKKLLFIIACGVYPGLTEIYPRYILEKYFDKISSLKIYFTTQGKLSFSSAYDYICGIENKVGKGMKYIHRGCISNIHNNKIQQLNLGEPAGSRYCYPIINVEFERMCHENNIEEAYFYNSFYNKEDIENAMLIIKDSKRLGKDILARKMMGTFIGDSKYSKFTMINISCEGIKDNNEIEIEGKILYKGAGNNLSGIVGANVVENIVDNKEENCGVYYVADIISVDKFMNNLINNGIIVNETIKEYEEGEII